MFKLIKILCLTCVLTLTAFAQTQTTDEYEKNEYYVGYSHQQVEGGDVYRPVNGAEFSYVRNVHRYFGLKGDISAAYRGNETFQINTTDATTGNAYAYQGRFRSSVYNFLGGVQVKNNASRARVKPFGHALAGVALQRSKNTALTCVQGNCPSFVTNSAPFSFKTTNFALALGGGLDIRLSDRVDFRAIQVDYNPIFRSGVQNNVRFGVGFVFK
jgi:opacity protein-like surface antigen